MSEQKTKVAVLTTHPIQYQVPWFRLLSEQEGIELTVLYCLLPDDTQQGAGFGVTFQWDVPLLDGYNYRVLKNVSSVPSVTQFKGCDTPEIYNVLRAEQFDAVIVNGWVVKSCLQTVWACRRLKIPCIVRGESNALRPRTGWKQHIHRPLLRQYAAFLAIGSSNRKFYLDRGVPADRIFMAPYCVDNAFFAAAAERHRDDRAALRAGWHIPEDAVVFLFVGKFEPKKHPLDLVNAFAAVVAPAHLLMVGSGELLDACKEIAESNQLPVSFAGFMNQGEIGKAYAASDALLLASDVGETWGLVVNEAMACALPAFVSDQVGCHSDLIESGKTGDVFPKGDVAAITHCVDRAASDPDALRRMGEQARVRIAGYTFEKVVAAVRAALAVCVPATKGDL